MEYWDSKNGMPNEQINNIYQTHDGFIWTTSYSGLLRFDGISFTSFNSRNTPEFKADPITTLLVETKDSTLWIPTPNSGLLSYKNGVFKVYLSDYSGLVFRGITAEDEMLIQTVTGEDRYLLFDSHSASHSSLSESEGLELFLNGIITYKNNNIEDKSGNRWLYSNGVLYRVYNGELNPIGSEQGIPSDLLLLNILSDSQGRVWLATRRGLYTWNGQQFETYPEMGNIQFKGGRSTYNMLEDRRGGIWAATGIGLAYLAADSDKFIFYPHNDDPLTQAVSSNMEDREGNLWFSSSHGLIKFSQSKFKTYSQKDGLAANRIEAVCALEDEKYLVAAKSQLYIIENGTVSPYKFKYRRNADLKDDPVHIIKDSRNNIWISYATGKVMKISPTDEKLYSRVGRYQVRYVFEDRSNKIWFGLAYAGIGFINDKEEMELLELPKVDFDGRLISSIRKLKNKHWIVTTHNSGVIEIDEKGNPTYYDDKNGLNSLGFFNSHEDEDGTVWLTSSNGITRMKNGAIDNLGFTSGIPGNAIFQFLVDNQNHVWLPTNIGLIRAKKKELNDYLDGQIEKINWRLYDDGDGMLNRRCVGARHSTYTPDGRLLVPTFGGLLEVDPHKLEKNEVPPSVVIHKVLRDDVEQENNQNSTFEPGNHRYIFSYSGLSLVAPKKVQFKFKLDGYDDEWISAKGDRKAYYTNISSGNYTFKVIASNNDGVWNTIGDSYSFHISPFFYDTLWFRLLSVMALSFLIWGIVKWRTSAARKISEALESEVEERTTDLNRTNKKLSLSLEELLATQSQLIQSEKMASLGELTAGIAHEIQNPLNFVNNFSEVSSELLCEMKDALGLAQGDRINEDMQEAIEIADDVIDNLEKITHHGKRADSIVKGMLQHSRTSRGEKMPTDINALAEEYLRLAYHGLRAKDSSFNATMKTNFDESIGKINVIPQDIGRVILNLITNAFQAVQERSKSSDNTYKPTVTVTTKNIPTNLSNARKQSVLIIVSDNGKGIPDDIRDKIFQPFFTTKPTGTATGL
ncbi:MAG: triple tyrosine motif-containing protein, partial [Saprospiraceae bacterium]